MADDLKEAKGVDGQLELMKDRVLIKRKGFMATANTKNIAREDREIPIDQITSIEFKKAGQVINGYIQFAFIVDPEIKDVFAEDAQDRDSVMFTSKQQPAFEEMRIAIEKQIASAEIGGTKASKLKKIEALSKLAEKGIISKKEFKEKKEWVLKK